MFNSIFWRDLANRLYRQARQTAVPILVVLSVANNGLDIGVVLAALGSTLLVTLGKAALLAIAGAKPATLDVSPLVLAADRALPAALGVLLSVWPADAYGFTKVHWWPDVASAALSAAVLALLDARSDHATLLSVPLAQTAEGPHDPPPHA